ncbi:MAG: hypothetical protein ABSF28_14260 [Terracidiphilus sp.]|jgi:hypothetical protein
MSLLQDSPDLVDVKPGEDYAKGSSHVVWAAWIAAALVTTAIAIYVIANQKPPVATGEIVAVWAHPQHAESSGVDASGEAMAKESFDQVLVFTQVRLHNQSKGPLYLHNVMTNIKLDDGIHSSYAASAADYERVYIAYPNMPVPRATPLATTDSTIAPGQTLEGTFVSSFRLSKQEWDARKDLNFTFALRYQPSLVLAPQGAVIDQ